MPKNMATKKSVDRQLKSYKRKIRKKGKIGILVEGDSWFSTPVESWGPSTLVDRLKSHERNGEQPFVVVSVANPGAELTDMITPDNIDLAFAADGLTETQKYDVVLLSCGGNDVLGKRLAEFLFDAAPGTAVRQCLDQASSDEEAARCVLDCARYRNFLDQQLAPRLKRFRRDVLAGLGLGQARILLHGYDYPIPDGRPLKALGFEFGPWLLPVFKQHKIQKKYHAAVVKLLIDEFNAMLQSIASSQPLFHYLDFRGLLTTTADWADEIHPHSNTGMIKLREELVKAIHAIADGTAASVIGGGRITSEFRCS